MRSAVIFTEENGQTTMWLAIGQRRAGRRKEIIGDRSENLIIESFCHFFLTKPLRGTGSWKRRTTRRISGKKRIILFVMISRTVHTFQCKQLRREPSGILKLWNISWRIENPSSLKHGLDSRSDDNFWSILNHSIFSSWEEAEHILRCAKTLFNIFNT